MTGDRIVREGIRVVAMIVMAIDIVEQTPHMLAQGVIEDQEPRQPSDRGPPASAGADT